MIVFKEYLEIIPSSVSQKGCWNGCIEEQAALSPGGCMTQGKSTLAGSLIFYTGENNKLQWQQPTGLIFTVPSCILIMEFIRM
jgi:hypothetical protein